MSYLSYKTYTSLLCFRLRHTLFVLERKWRCHPLLGRFYPKILPPLLKGARGISRRVLAVFLALLILIPGVFIFLRPHQASADWFDDSYAYRQIITFTHNASLTDASMRLTVSNTNTLVSAGKMQTDCDDSRFADGNGKVLRFKLVSGCNSASTVYDVIFPTVISGSNLAYFYYGNPSALSKSDSTVPAGATPNGTPSFATEEKAPSPALSLKFDEGTGTTTQDSSANNNDAAISGAAWRTQESCLSGNCLFFDGVDDVATVTNADSIDLDRNLAAGFTFDAWLRVASSAAEEANSQIFNKGTNTYLRVTNKGPDGKADLEASLALATTNATLNISKGIDLNKWTHIAISYNTSNNQLKIYINGTNRGTSTNGDGAPATDSNDLLIGGTTGAHFHGFIDEFKIFPFERTASQVKTSTASKIPSVHGVSSSFGDDQSYLSNGLIGYWKLDESSGNASDTSGNGLTLTNNSSTSFTSGKFAGAGWFNASSSDYFSTTTLISNINTVSFWASPSAATDEFINLTSTAYITASSGTVTAAGFTSPSVYVNGVRNGTVTANVWNHILITTDTAINANAFEVGRGGGAYTNGKIDDVRIYNRALSPSEVRSLYDWAPGPAGWWKFDENTGGIANDSSGNGNNMPMALAGWTYWIPLTISNSGSALSDYQASVSANTLSLINAGHMQSDCDDVRFYDSDNATPLNYWLQSGSCNTAATIFWVKIPSIPNPSKTIYMYYGNSAATTTSNGDNTFEFFDDFEPQCWQKLSVLPSPRADASSSVLNDKIYIIGGNNDTVTDPRAEVWEYDPAGDSYTPKTGLNAARWGLMSIPFGGKIYTFGGHGAGNSADLYAEMYDPSLNTWTNKAMPPVAIRDQGVFGAADANYIYLFYGNYLYRYDTSNDTYALLSSTPPNNLTNWGTMAIYNNKIYIIGGHYSNNSVGTVMIYNLGTSSWESNGAAMPVSLFGILRENPIIGDNIYILQGYRVVNGVWNDEFFSRFWKYNITSNSWTWGRLGYMDADGVTGGVIGNKIYTFGGRRDPNSYGIDFAGVLDTASSDAPARWIDVVTANWRLDNSALIAGSYQVNAVPQLRTANQVLGANSKVISSMRYLTGSTGFGGLMLQSNGGLYYNTDNSYLSPYIDVSSNLDYLIRETGASFPSITSTSPVSTVDTWHNYVTTFGASTVTQTRDGTTTLSFSDSTYRSGYIQVFKTSDLHPNTDNIELQVDYVAVAKYAATEPTVTPGNESLRTIGKIGGALKFNGVNNYSVSTDSASLSITGNLTLESWIKLGAISSEQTIIGKWDETTGTDDRSYRLWIDSSNKLNLSVSTNGSTVVTHTGTTTFSANTWYHVTGVYNAAGTMDLYVNGVLDAAQKASGVPASIDDNVSNLYIGAKENTSGNLDTFFNGSIDDVRVYNYIRTAKQIVSDINAGHPAVGTPIGSTVGHWNFDEGYGTTAHDKSPNTNNLTLSSTAWINSGKFAKAWNGDGVRYLSRADDDDFDFAAADDFSLTLWFKSNSESNPGATEYLLNKSFSGGTQEAGYALYANTNGTVCVGIDDDAAWTPDVTACSATDIYDKTWHHIVGTRNTATDQLYLYIDGIQVQNSADTTTATLANARILYLGDRDGTDNGDEFAGDIDEVKIYRLALNSQEIKVEYNQGKAAVWGALSTDPDNRTASNSAARSYCPPGNSEGNCAAGSDPSPVAHWTLDENTGGSANDSSGNGNTGTLTSGPLWTRGKIGSGLKFNGVNDYVDAGTGTSLNITGNITLTAWIKTISSGENTITSRGLTGSADHTLDHDIENGHNSFWYANGYAMLTADGVEGTKLINDGNWHHVAALYNGTSIELYTDGVYDNGKTKATTPTSNTSLKVLIGNLPGYSFYFNGSIDDVRIYNYARTPAQIAWDYNRGRPVAWWKFDECGGTTMYEAATSSASPATARNGKWSGSGGGNTSAGACSIVDAATAWYNGSIGKYNGSLDFDGTDDTVNMSNSYDMNDGQDFALEAWIYRDTFTTDDTIIAKRNGQTLTDVGYLLYIDDANDDINFSVSDVTSNDTFSINGKTAITSTGWRHIVAIFDRDSAANSTIYLDGRDDKENTSGTIGNVNSLFNAVDFRVGSESDGGQPFSGQIDNVKIYNYVPTSTQIRTFYNEDSAIRFGPQTGSP